MTPTLPAFLVLLPLVSASAVLHEQKGKRATQHRSTPKKPTPKKKALWPYLKPVRKAIAKDKVPLLVSKNAARAAAARDQIRRYGAGVCPVLLKAIHPRRKPEIVAAVKGLLDEFTIIANVFEKEIVMFGLNKLTYLFCVLSLIWGVSSFASDGVLEINQACVATGCFAGDAAGFPVRVTQAGSYIFTSDLDVRGEANPEDVNAVEVQTSDPEGVVIDLNGFRIIGPTNCPGTPQTCC